MAIEQEYGKLELNRKLILKILSSNENPEIKAKGLASIIGLIKSNILNILDQETDEGKTNEKLAEVIQTIIKMDGVFNQAISKQMGAVTQRIGFIIVKKGINRTYNESLRENMRILAEMLDVFGQ